MIIVGLTGSIGMGKSTTAEMFRQMGIRVHDSDRVVHDLYANEAVAPLQELFPQAVVEGVVNREILASVVLNNPEQMQRLEELIHPMVREKERAFLRRAEQDKEKLVVLDIPLLFETGGEKRVDVVVVVTASAEEQRRRVLSRPAMSEKKLDAILARQVPDQTKRERADFVIDTGLGMENAKRHVGEIIKQLELRDKTRTESNG